MLLVSKSGLNMRSFKTLCIPNAKSKQPDSVINQRHNSAINLHGMAQNKLFSINKLP